MKKVFFTILSLFILSCSSDDDNNNNDNSSEPTVNSDLVGTWVGSGTDDDDPLIITLQTIVFNQDGTGSVTDAIVLTGESNVSELTWYSNATTIFGTLEGQLDEIGYVLSEQNQQLDLTFPEGDVGIYVRLE
ncbi:MAG: hypothetical protein P8P13_01450 [Flavobacteriaceae bacterium]|jgi:hypothetical protein|nr:hypothetical protein [Flavobacteriaceae bacterium]MDA7727620.1 hypothetical protein [Flavobacteriaceae bacterium]MDB0003834.1 hypothetical protein [Flavobacteriaceae bacterium]MDG1309143.1 hypothetical protein [Flavobacteriaceae bacterium]|tara:strand:+ start:2149 stop:2544 length:396 start_codon:yes stop_codon:yes gene_type:complete